MKGDQCASVEHLAGLILKAAACGSRRQTKKAIQRGIKVDAKNEDGQTPLFLACLEGHESVIDLLLRHDADPNLRSLNGSTPVHAAAFAGHVRTLEKLIEAGGDLRFHDNEDRLPRDWALLQDDPKKKRRMIDFIEKSRLFAMSSKGSPEFLHPQKDKSLVGTIRNLSLRKLNPSALLAMFRQKGSHELHNVKSAGFGKIYFEGKNHKTGTMAAVPLIDELDVTHNNHGVTYNNGSFMVMESMLWGKTPVTAKRLHRHCPQGGVVDLLIEEHDHIVKLRHSSILLLMAICQTENLEGMVLIYEPVAVGSLYYYLHERFESVSPSDVRNVARHIASALLFLHRQNIIHCWVTSHAVQLVTPYTAKLGNLEYAIKQDSRGEKMSLVAQNTYANAAYNWMAPEVMDGTPPSFASDLYSFCVVIWEMLMGEVPWSGKTADVIVVDILEQGSQLPVEEANIPMPYNVVLEWGLSLKPAKRKISMEQLVEILETCSMCM
ncbi:inactive serine/threonine-protein kinase TEX14-like [Lineus longissimus]|uniref:inactive serine/threonine-protein kinase TEX14-like n=1 Tax=Lineus longissimus TaxID=88925 RepID=UPI00315DC23F